MKTIRAVFPILMLSALSAALLGQEPGSVFKVKYISAEHVYIDGGTAQGLAVGDKLIARNADGVVADLEVIFVSENSASCKILKKEGEIQAGNLVSVYEKSRTPVEEKEEEPPVFVEQEPQTEPESTTAGSIPSSRSGGTTTKISGSVSAQIYHYDDLSERDLDFTQPTLRLNFRAKNLWGKDYHFAIRTRARYNQRTRSYNNNIPQEEWRNRIYEFSFSYDNEDALFNFKTGRIISNHLSGVGYIDGLMVQQNVSHALRYGVFVGTQPEWQYSDFQTSLQKYGGYVNFRHGDFRGFRYDGTVAAAGAYHSGTVSREFLYIRNTISNSSGWHFYQSAEIDINREWRKEKTGKDIALSNLFLSARYRFSRSVNVGLSYDNRKNYWTYETRTLSDSLFDDFLRRGLRGNISVRLPHNYTIFANAGYRSREGDPEPTYSYGGGINKTNFILHRLFVSLNANGFSNPFSDGTNLTAQIEKYFMGANYLSLGYGMYAYKFGSTNMERTNQWLRLNGQFQLIRRVYVSTQYEYGLGEDVEGHRLLAEIGYRF